MKLQYVKDTVEEFYELPVSRIEKIKNVYKIESCEKYFCLKVIKYEYKHFNFILSAIKHLQSRGFEKIPEILKTKEDKDFITLENCFAYLTDWISARESNYDNPYELESATIKLAKLHEQSKGFNVTDMMKPRIGWNRWIEIYSTRKDEILDFKKRINLKNSLSEFDEFYLNVMENELKRADTSIKNLNSTEYFEVMKLEMADKGFCHHDYAHHNVLIDENDNINIIDFDYCILDTHLHDLSSLLLRKMKNGKWNIEDALFILNTYSKVTKINKEDIRIMAAFMEFPQDYWQVGIQYYWEEQPWGEDYFVKKLMRICEDCDEKQEFINSFMEVDFN